MTHFKASAFSLHLITSTDFKSILLEKKWKETDCNAIYNYRLHSSISTTHNALCLI